MKILRLVLGVIITIILLTFLVESIEFLLVKTVSGQPMEYLFNNQSDYFKIRNQPWILVSKLIYTFVSALLSGWLGSKITKYLQRYFAIIVSLFQGLVFLYAMLFSEYKNTLPTYYWFLLFVTILFGINIGYVLSKKINSQ